MSNQFPVQPWNVELALPVDSKSDNARHTVTIFEEKRRNGFGNGCKLAVMNERHCRQEIVKVNEGLKHLWSNERIHM